MKIWTIFLPWLLTVSLTFAAADVHTIAYLKNHYEEWPKEVTLTQAVTFSIPIDGKPAGTSVVPAQTIAKVISISDQGIEIEVSNNRTFIPPEQTDLWDRVKAYRDSVEAKELQDLALQLSLPINSAQPGWYREQINNLLEPWLASHSGSDLTPKVLGTKETFEKEAERVEAGEVRRGDRWYSAEEAVAEKSKFDLEDLQQQLQSPDPATLVAIIPSISKYKNLAVHTKLLDMAVIDINNFESASPPPPQWVKLKPTLLARRTELKFWSQREWEAVNKLEEAKAKLQAAEITPAIAILNSIQYLWADSEPLYLFYVEQITAALNKYQASLNQVDIPTAIQWYEVALSLQQTISPSLTPLPAELAAQIMDATPTMQTVITIQNAYANREFDTVLLARLDRLPEKVKVWVTKLQATILIPRQKSEKALSESIADLGHISFKSAESHFRLAQSLWPENPDVLYDSKVLVVTKIVGIIVGIIFILLLPFLWSVARTLIFCYSPHRPKARSVAFE